MSWDPNVVSGDEPLYFGPEAGHDTEELDRRGLDQDKKPSDYKNSFSDSTAENSHAERHLDGPPQSPEVGQCRCYCQGQGEDVPTWDEFTQTTTFHGVRYIFDKTPCRIRR